MSEDAHDADTNSGPSSGTDSGTDSGAGRTDAPPHGQHIAVALSGGGHRATLFGLGALIYLVDAGKGPELASVASISGGSLANGYVGLHTDLTTVTPDQLRSAVTPLARAVSTGGTVWARWFTSAYLAVLVALLAAASVLCVPLDGAWPFPVWAVTLVLVGWLARRRSWVAAKAFDDVLFHRARLDQMHTGVDHVITSCDLQTCEQVYFSSRFVHSYRLGWGVPAEARVGWAAQASACLPGAFAPVSRSVASHRFTSPRPEAPSRFLLVDGGVYDNMGTEWAIRIADRVREGSPPSPPPHICDELIVVNASAAQEVTSRGSVRWPIVGEITALLADKDVLYDQTTAVRRRLLDARFRAARRGEHDRSGPLDGALVQIDRSPFDLPPKFIPAYGPDDELATRARRVLAALGDTRDAWAADAEANRRVKTKLSKIPADRAARLLRHAYVLTMVNAVVLLDYPLLPIPELASFHALVQQP